MAALVRRSAHTKATGYLNELEGLTLSADGSVSFVWEHRHTDSDSTIRIHADFDITHRMRSAALSLWSAFARGVRGSTGKVRASHGGCSEFL